ncbi:MAG: hypothetical protein LBP99_04410 [Azoarcus sp.]|jgi:hypothetical protein|nr:hypothetical protein [Azoarcus sp.]
MRFILGRSPTPITHGQERPARAIALIRGSGAVMSGCFHPVGQILKL